MKIVASLLVVLGMFFLSGCNDDKKEDVKSIPTVKTENDGNLSDMNIDTKLEEVDSKDDEQTDMNMNASGLAVTTTEEVIVDENETKENVEVKENNTTINDQETTTKTEDTTSSVDVKSLFTRCSACHGQNAELKALGKSQVIKDWDAEKISAALHGYKNGTYGGAMKGLMQTQAKTLSDDDISALSTYISNM